MEAAAIINRRKRWLRRKSAIIEEIVLSIYLSVAWRRYHGDSVMESEMA
jgi:hypothetical protein